MNYDLNDQGFLDYCKSSQREEKYDRWREPEDWENIEDVIRQAKEQFPSYKNLYIGTDYDYDYASSYYYVCTEETLDKFYTRYWKKWQKLLEVRKKYAIKKEKERKAKEEAERLKEIERKNREEKYQSMIAEYGPRTPKKT